VNDAKLLDQLVEKWDAVEGDPKLEEFLVRMENDLLDPAINPQQKLVIFSESKETSQYLYSELKKAGYSKTLLVHAGNRKSLRETIRTNFDANIPMLEQNGEYDIIVTTEVLAEGVNLHRANVIVNYDTPWNSTRLMQRIGRLNRIGSVAKCIYNYIFYPTAKVDNDIELQKRAVMKLQAFHSALGEDSQIYSQDEEIGTFGLFDKNIEEERDESLEFLMKLRQFRRENVAAFRRIRNMPLRARCGRKDKTKPLSTLAFIRNQHRDAFYFIGAKGKPDALAFVECARQFEAKAHEKSVPLHNQHHSQVAEAEKDFSEQIQREAAVGQVVDIRQGPQETKALRFLSAVEKLDLTGEDERFTIKAALKAVKVGRFQQLVRDVNKLQTSLNKQKIKTSTILDTLMGILNKYPLDDIGEDSRPALSVKGYANLKPDIIISESFVS
jgi:superfamily II DNA/RNA helicase